MKKILAISPYFPPANTPDMQRLRMALPYLRENGWEATVVTANPVGYSAPRDEFLAETVPPGTRVIRLRSWNERTCRRFGFGHLANRIAWPWRSEVRAILQRERFDAVLFTTTQFAVMANAPHWRRVCGVPYVIDLQDPVYVPAGSYAQGDAPGGKWKYRASLFVSRFIERAAFACPAAVVATSAHYPEVLRVRYPHLQGIPMEVLPFGVPESDLELVDKFVPKNTLFERREGDCVVFYAGRGGPDLHPALRALFRASADVADESPAPLAAGLKFVFVGTSYGPEGSGRQQVLGLARDAGLHDRVTDQPERRGYFEVMKAAKEADCALVLGSASADYTASKALLVLAAAKRVLAIVRKDSLVQKLYSSHPKVLMCSFDESPEEARCIEEIKRHVGSLLRGSEVPPPSRGIDEIHGAKFMTRALCSVLDLALEPPSRQ